MELGDTAATGSALNVAASICNNEDEEVPSDDEDKSTCNEEDEGASFGDEDDEGASACNEEDEGASFGDEDDDGASACNEEDEGGSRPSEELLEQLVKKSPRSSAISTSGILLAIRNLLMFFPVATTLAKPGEIRFGKVRTTIGANSLFTACLR